MSAIGKQMWLWNRGRWIPSKSQGVSKSGSNLITFRTATYINWLTSDIQKFSLAKQNSRITKMMAAMTAAINRSHLLCLCLDLPYLAVSLTFQTLDGLLVGSIQAHPFLSSQTVRMDLQKVSSETQANVGLNIRNSILRSSNAIVMLYGNMCSTSCLNCDARACRKYIYIYIYIYINSQISKVMTAMLDEFNIMAIVSPPT